MHSFLGEIGSAYTYIFEWNTLFHIILAYIPKGPRHLMCPLGVISSAISYLIAPKIYTFKIFFGQCICYFTAPINKKKEGLAFRGKG